MSLNVDGNEIEIFNETSKIRQLNKALRDPAEFKEFVANPKDYAAKYNLNIDDEISKRVAERLKRIESVHDLVDELNDPINPIAATVAAVAVGAFAWAGAKVAVAF